MFVFSRKQKIVKQVARKMLVKVTTGVYFLNILNMPYLYESALHSFSLVSDWLLIFWQKIIGINAAGKILVKFTRSFLHFCQ